MAQPTSLHYTPLSDRAQKVVDSFLPPEDKIEAAFKKFSYVQPRSPDKEGDTEILDGVTFTHHFVYGPGDAERVLWHYVEAGPGDAPVEAVSLHRR